MNYFIIIMMLMMTLIIKGYYCSYKNGKGENHHELLTKEIFTDAYLRAEVNNALKKPQKGRDIRRIPKHEDKRLIYYSH